MPARDARHFHAVPPHPLPLGEGAERIVPLSPEGVNEAGEGSRYLTRITPVGLPARHARNPHPSPLPAGEGAYAGCAGVKGSGSERFRGALGALLYAALGLAVVLSVSPLQAQDAVDEQPTWDPQPPDQHEVGFVELTPELRQAVDEGLAWLAQSQRPDGSFGGERYARHVGMTGLACMAFMADGHLPGRGEYGEQVQRGLEFVLDSAGESGLIAADTSHGPMYGHGFATLFLGEIYGQTRDPRLREVLLKAVRLIVNSQNNEGGWRYQPVPVDADISVTICQIMALRSARNAGLHVPKETIDRAIEYVRACQNESDGGFRYMLNTGGSEFPRSAAGVASLYYAGVYEGNAIDQGLDYLMDATDRIRFRSGSHYFYGQYYAAQAMFLAGGEYWGGWFPRVRDELIEHQQDDGRWQSDQGDAYGTAMCLLVLQVPNRLLPIFQR